ncbi:MULTISPECIES: hypothetical protein [unclassified Pantoea]|uniref:hypothetical protein n=1 Tax=unclassified Pantoea TaxID=2630326 RepID=UPI00255478B9|nr:MULTISPECIES: hypothetical protein [unclassified Pantoea]
MKNSGGLIWPGLCWLSVSDEDINLLPDGALSRWQKAERRYFADASLYAMKKNISKEFTAIACQNIQQTSFSFIHPLLS